MSGSFEDERGPHPLLARVMKLVMGSRAASCAASVRRSQRPKHSRSPESRTVWGGGPLAPRRRPPGPVRHEVHVRPRRQPTLWVQVGERGRPCAVPAQLLSASDDQGYLMSWYLHLGF